MRGRTGGGSEGLGCGCVGQRATVYIGGETGFFSRGKQGELTVAGFADELPGYSTGSYKLSNTNTAAGQMNGK